MEKHPSATRTALLSNHSRTSSQLCHPRPLDSHQRLRSISTLFESDHSS
ncbi:hypothetical protein AHF37_12362 [Paragonimus kellicotti]|nr:hypothetical protein AHF37_12362 [Paragonimus kellicotti]